MSENRNFNSVYDIKLAQIAALEGDTTKKYDSVYETELEMLRLLEEGGGGGAVIDDNNTSTGTVWSSSKTLEKITELGLQIEIVEELPETGEAKTIYLVPSEDEEEGNVYDEYLWINNAWERMGSTKIDLSQYYTKDETNALLDDKVDLTLFNTSIGEINDEISDINDEISDISTAMINKVDVSDFLEAEEVTAKALNKLNASIGEIDGQISDISTAMNNKVDLILFNSSIGEINNEIDNLNDEIADISTAMSNNVDVSTLIDDEAVVSDAIYNINIDISTLYQEKVYSGQIHNIYALTQAEYDDIEDKDVNTMYVITDAI